MRKKRCIFCGGLNAKRHGIRSKKSSTSFGKRPTIINDGSVITASEPLATA